MTPHPSRDSTPSYTDTLPVYVTGCGWPQAPNSFLSRVDKFRSSGRRHVQGSSPPFPSTVSAKGSVPTSSGNRASRRGQGKGPSASLLGSPSQACPLSLQCFSRLPLVCS